MKVKERMKEGGNGVMDKERDCRTKNEYERGAWINNKHYHRTEIILRYW